jgi:hypothetical protein
MGVVGQSQAPDVLPPQKRGGIHCTEDWVRPRTGLGGWGELKVS